MTAQSIMNPHPNTLHVEDKVSDGIKIIMNNRYRRLPVIDHQGCFQGIFGVNCLLRMVLPKAVVMEQGLDNIQFMNDNLSDLHQRLKQFENQPVAICMHQDSIQIAPDTPLLETLLLLYKTKASIPVVNPDSQKLMGVISYWDVGEKILAAEN